MRHHWIYGAGEQRCRCGVKVRYNRSVRGPRGGDVYEATDTAGVVTTGLSRAKLTGWLKAHRCTGVEAKR